MLDENEMFHGETPSLHYLHPRFDVLFNSDILSLIFAHFDLVEDPMVYRKSLYWAALTCKAFTEPALDVLWRSMNSLIPLLKLLPKLFLIEDEYVCFQSSDFLS